MNTTEPLSESSSPNPIAERRLTPVRLLVVDDDEHIHFFVRTALRAMPVDIVDAYDGKEAIEKFESQKFDLIMLDLLMPNFSGSDFMRGLHALAVPLPPIIVISSIIDAELMKTCLLVGVTDFINKPLMPQVVRDKLAPYLDAAGTL